MIVLIILRKLPFLQYKFISRYFFNSWNTLEENSNHFLLISNKEAKYYDN